MLEGYYVKPSTIDRIRASWRAPQIESYLEWLEAHGYSRLVVYRRLPLLFHFAEFAQKKGCRDVASCKVYIKEFVSQWLEQHGANAKTAVAVRKHAIDAECGVRKSSTTHCRLASLHCYAEITLRGKMAAVAACLPSQLQCHRAEVMDGAKMRNC
jgi:hypothetical protein